MGGASPGLMALPCAPASTCSCWLSTMMALWVFPGSPRSRRTGMEDLGAQSLFVFRSRAGRKTASSLAVHLSTAWSVSWPRSAEPYGHVAPRCYWHDPCCDEPIPLAVLSRSTAKQDSCLSARAIRSPCIQAIAQIFLWVIIHKFSHVALLCSGSASSYGSASSARRFSVFVTSP